MITDKVFCKNCKHFRGAVYTTQSKFPDDPQPDCVMVVNDGCTYWIIEYGEPKIIYDSVYGKKIEKSITKNVHGKLEWNKDFNCPYYKRKLWKIYLIL